MSKKIDDELFYYSTKEPKGQRIFILIFSGFSFLASLAFFGGAVYTFINAGSVEADSTVNGDRGLSVMVSIPGIVLLLLAFILYRGMMREKNYQIEHWIYGDRIVYKEIFPKENRSTKNTLWFNDMDWCLIGNNSRFVPGNGKGVSSRYQNEALLLLPFEEDIRILTLTGEEELYQWVDFLKELGLPVYYLPYNLVNVVTEKELIDFDTMDKLEWDDVEDCYHPVFVETRGKMFETWEPVYKTMATAGERKGKELFGPRSTLFR